MQYDRPMHTYAHYIHIEKNESFKKICDTPNLFKLSKTFKRPSLVLALISFTYVLNLTVSDVQQRNSKVPDYMEDLTTCKFKES